MSSSDAGVAGAVNRNRLWGRLMALAEIGATPNGGVHRFALSEEEIPARDLLRRWGLDLGLQPFTDDAANLFLRLEGSEPDLPPLLVGSHIDTQPTGGKFDGAYGVLAAFEAVEAMIDSGHRPKRSVEVVAWMNEEGSRFAPGMMGSAVFTGKRSMREIERVVDEAGVSVREALDRLLAADRDIPRRPFGFPVAGFLEAHIEQGVLLEQHGLPVGVVTGIQGKKTFRVEVTGEESHAGTSQRRQRRDALVSAVDIIRALEDAIWDEEDTVRFTIGRLVVKPNAPSVVPSSVVFAIDLRHYEAEVVETLGARIPEICEAARGKCDVVARQLLHDDPVLFPEPVRQRLRAAADRAGRPHTDLLSPAGHDARYLSGVCPTGMIFIPCKDGISHNEAESITPADAEAGAAVLAEAIVEWAEAG